MAYQIVNPLKVDPKAIQKSSKFKNYGGSTFDMAMGAVSAMSPMATTTAGMYGSPNSAAVLAAAFSGINELGAQRSQFGGGVGVSYGGTGAPYLSAGFGAQSVGGLPDPNAPVIAGSDFSQMDMINTMNQNNWRSLTSREIIGIYSTHLYVFAISHY